MDCIFGFIKRTHKQERAVLGSNEFVLFTNSDMMFPPKEFVSSLLSVAYADIAAEPVLMVGQRTDVMFQQSFSTAMEESPTMNREAYETWFSEALKQGTLHIDFGVDFFAMSADLIPRAFPPFLVGRWRRDNALLAEYIVAAPGIPRSVPSARCASRWDGEGRRLCECEMSTTNPRALLGGKPPIATPKNKESSCPRR
jgi:hypothetical protein